MRIIKHMKDLIKILIAFITSSFMRLNKKNRDIWLISERKDEAEDNGYHLYKYIRENHPGQKVFYTINKKSQSYLKIEKYNTVIQFNSLKHYIYYFLCNKHISAFQFFGVPETPFLWKLEERGVIKKKKVFLQHGITKEMLPFLLYKNTNYDLFICGAQPEYDYLKVNYGYPEGNLKYLGFCRFDNLHDYETKKQILLMPTWRQWIGMTNDDNDEEEEQCNFINTEYYKTYNSLLNNKKLHSLLADKNFELIFYPHPEMQRFIRNFKRTHENIKIANRRNCNLQELLKESEILITDYSSIAFDCAYMRKNLIYYQFDQDMYYSNHFEKGYFDCERDGFGPVVKEEKVLVKEIEGAILNRNITTKYIERAKKFFPIYDKDNCKRNYEAIKNI